MLILILASSCMLSAVSAAGPFPVSISRPFSASSPLMKSFVSLSIEFSSFGDFAGNLTHPNNFSYNLLTNLRIQGSLPIVRVGGNTQDYATYDASQKQALVGTIDATRNKDYPTTISIGPSFFDSYSTWPGVTFLHGFNQAKNGSVGHQNLLDTVPLACKALAGKTAYWQLGNEADIYKISAQGPVRPSWWNETDYVGEWLNKTQMIRQLVQKNCPKMIKNGKFKFYAPGFGGTGNSLNMITTWASGLDVNSDIAFIDSHNYIGGATQPGITLQGTLMNHSSNVASVAKHLNESRLLKHTGLPYVLGEVNSLYNEGTPGLSNSFGAALWGVDFNLYCAATNISRVHMHQGTNYRYASWQPIETANQTMGTKAPYYANIAVATMLGNLTAGNVSIADLELGSDYDTAYAAYVNGRLHRIAAIQMREYNYTNNTQGARPVETYQFQLPSNSGVSKFGIQRLMANGSDAITGVTFDGYSYNYELNKGKPVLLKNVTMGETIPVRQDGVISVEVPWSSAVILNLLW